MTKQEAKQAIKEGKKVTHEYFTPGEFVMKDPEEGVVVFEDGVRQVEREFWAFRATAEWNEGWEVI